MACGNPKPEFQSALVCRILRTELKFGHVVLNNNRRHDVTSCSWRVCRRLCAVREVIPKPLSPLDAFLVFLLNCCSVEGKHIRLCCYVRTLFGIFSSWFRINSAGAL